MNIFEDSILYFELTTLIFSLVCYKKFKLPFYKFFILYVITSSAVEIIGGFFAGESTFWIFNLYTFFEFLWITLIFYNLNKEKNSRKIMMYLVIIFYIIYFLSFQYIILQKYTVIILALFVTPFFFLHLKELLNSNKIMSFQKEISFWITVGFLIYYLGTVPFFSLLYIGGMQDRILFTILALIVLVTHLIFIVGLIWSKRIQK